jgi:hypothetical protein
MTEPEGRDDVRAFAFKLQPSRSGLPRTAGGPDGAQEFRLSTLYYQGGVGLTAWSL